MPFLMFILPEEKMSGQSQRCRSDSRAHASSSGSAAAERLHSSERHNYERLDIKL